METDKAKRTQVREAVRFHRQYAGSEGPEYTPRAAKRPSEADRLK